MLPGRHNHIRSSACESIARYQFDDIEIDFEKLRATKAGFRIELSAMTIPIKAGKSSINQDSATSGPVATINEAMAHKHWDKENPLGKQIEIAGTSRTIVGVIGDLREAPLHMIPRPEIYVPFLQVPRGQLITVVQAKQADPLNISAAVKEEIRALDPTSLSPASRRRTECAVLGVERVGVRDNSLDLGGHSLSAVRIIAGVRRTFEVDMPLRSLFESPAVEAMAQAVVSYPRLLRTFALRMGSVFPGRAAEVRDGMRDYSASSNTCRSCVSR